ncbi:MAG: carbohydrate ABC transporter permease [Gorillibacterium sp.]|nr:carbohydrate ABC transporter permease [Gorillibacterium sp.]
MGIQSKRKKIIGDTIRYGLMIIVGIMFILPFAWLVSTSFKQPAQIYEIPLRWLPDPPTLKNFIQGWTILPFGRYFANTTIITVLGTLGTVFSCSLVAYGFAKFRSKLSNMMFILVISTMMLPAQVTMIPTYMMFSKLHWVDTFLPLIVPQWFAVGAFYIFLLRQFFKTIPKELDDAALIDGCGSFRYFWQVIVPLSKPAMLTVTVFAIINNWNDFMGQLIYLNSDVNYTVAIGLSFFNSKYGTQQMSLLMAVSFLSMLPLLFVFFFAQKYFVQGITTTGIKG